jgi:tripartite-type tricarboxylate transporter receptor subunit TctC
MRNRIIVVFTAILLLGAGSATYVPAADFPTKPIELVCPYPPGGSVDMMCRLLSDIAPKYLGQPLPVITKTGATGGVAAADVINSKPDGYKITALTPDFFALTCKTMKVPFNPADLVPIGCIMEQKVGMIVRGDTPFKKFQDLVDFCKKNPNEYKIGHTGRGTTMHIATLIITKKTGIQVIEVPDKGGPEVIAGVLGGHFEAGLVPMAAVREQLRAGKAKYIVFFSDKRFAEQPDTETVTELGFPTAALPPFHGLWIHKNTPEDVKAKLINAFDKVRQDPALKEGIEKIGEITKFAGPEYMYAEWKRLEETCVPILKEIGLYQGK